jgi:hypothetical protein
MEQRSTITSTFLATGIPSVEIRSSSASMIPLSFLGKRDTSDLPKEKRKVLTSERESQPDAPYLDSEMWALCQALRFLN